MRTAEKSLAFFCGIYYNKQGYFAEMSERPKEHDWKSCVPRKGTEGSNPSLCATKKDCQQVVLFCGVEAVEPRAKRMYDIKVVSQPARRFMRAGGTRDAQPRGPLRGFGCISLCAKCVQSEPQPFLSVIVNCQIKCNTQRDFVQTNLAVFGSAKLSLAWRL